MTESDEIQVLPNTRKFARLSCPETHTEWDQHCHQSAMIELEDISKSFVLHQQGGRCLKVLNNFNLGVRSGETVVLKGPSGAGKSTVLRLIYGNYLADQGRVVLVGDAPTDRLELTQAHPRQIARFRRLSLAYVSQFLRVVPRMSTMEVVMEPALEKGLDRRRVYPQACELLERLGIRQQLWELPPSTFSGGEKQRVNIARGFIMQQPLMLLDEPTASLDKHNRNIVIDLINEAKQRGAALLGVFHDDEVIARIADRVVEMEPAENEE